MNSASPAIFSPCRQYRYLLMRRVGLAEQTCLFIMLNPSTADETQDDPTVRRCMGFARRWGFGVLVVVNIFAYRATDPQELYDLGGTAEGPENDFHIVVAAENADKIVAAWGNHGELRGRGAVVSGITDYFKEKRFHLALTKRGQPRHPLYVAKDFEPIPMM